MKGARIQIVRHYRASPAIVFDACSDPRQLALWLGPLDYRVTDLNAEVREGGAFRLVMTGDGETAVVEGVFERVERPRQLVHTWHWAQGRAADGKVSRITYDFDADGNGTKLTFTQEGLADDQADPHRKGWEEAFDKLEDLLA